MTVAATHAYTHRDHHPVTFTHVFKSAFGLAFLAFSGFEAGAPIFGYASTDSIGYGVAVAALFLGGLYGLRR